ncbi:ATP phosphoribosyltransferase [Corynebacterium efficiens YS-314]|uniref:ATP phosphoribosyltransferase n=1 Tax=Corynebacterium efficiens (strain DSM 44549 / YS-314 / AJ 12310 / JCM 11189 / NBRC 100395) TaxID=196164 RepID=HIS1_COREF|nr:ATP phosphoribosyltransferase [Corynebacterium efficiens]Q8FTD5.1 RecName: Full=ATP phosphoribosyltransferase; Short=ATP-PRT; Short=ATP-PRTase [Corynebacterium efficiens YS-314]EEW49745.1 ATP phosphoribosyltransferase [Corynebacterium efficiens YS-314]BAC18444.1 ATP phosphoribosyltransferase [Corynebacterium efficiens YS-314]
MLKIAVPNKGSLSERAMEILNEAGYAGRGDSKSLNVLDSANDVEFFYLRPKDIAIYVAGGQLDLGITGRDLAADSRADVHEVLSLGFGSSTFRYAAPAGQGWSIEKLEGKRIATSYPNLVRDDLAARGITAEVIRLDGAVEISIKLGVADAIADVVSTGRTLRQQGLEPFGESLCTSEAVIVGRRDEEITPAQRVLLSRIQGILHAQNYLMLDYNVDRDRLDEASAVTPGISGPTVSPLARENWVAVRAMVPLKSANATMDKLASIGAEAILASEIRIARI